MHRFFIEKENILSDDLITLTEDNYNHAKNVLRLKESDKIEVVCQGKLYLSKIDKIFDREIICKIEEKLEDESESDLDLYLYQAIAKGKKMDLIIQKATELGVKKIFPLNTKRTIVRLDKKGEKKRLSRWNQISVEAAKQSKRTEPLTVEEVMNIEDFKQVEGTVLIAYEEEDSQGIKEVLRSKNIKQPIHLVIGPEGGFTEEEVENLKSLGAKSVKIGPRILRTETASIVASSIILYELGDLGVI